METVIRMDKVIKRYGAKTAVNGISLQIGKGEIFGIVGPNGAGKTTLIEMAEGLRKADSGSIRVLGMDIADHAAAIKERIGVLFQATAIPPKAKVGELLRLFSSFYTRNADLPAVKRAFGLDGKEHALYKSLSGGWKQRVALALALINDPEIVFLDEPSMGLDPSARREMWSMIQSMSSEGRTVVVTTHYMEEAEALCDRVAIIANGTVMAVDTPERLKQQVNAPRKLRFRHEGQLGKEELEKLDGVLGVEAGPGITVLETADMDQTLQQLFRLADEQGWIVKGLQIEQASMDDVFNEMTRLEGRLA
ncbi:ABC transporter ATP-binding protein [Paenibacillus protaetiae]|uniref:ABC transporter ATP-binding protein n=1 Tax=Paenibacillus protaetiae TaxID=2509456 RepID=A0A4P6EU28_9BACL|nr:ABC transporter ATP-binding protein [Paenibacillus protaetiae]QAY65975.1 ABC transporter ATP-binding protein [Paenibacillus protaetiae]